MCTDGKSVTLPKEQRGNEPKEGPAETHIPGHCGFVVKVMNRSGVPYLAVIAKAS